MYKDCRTEQSAARQRLLERGLMELMQSKPFEEISISELCERMRVPRKSFYRYFSGKEGALAALVDHTLMEYYHENGASHRTDPVGDLAGFFAFWRSKRVLLDALHRSRLSSVLAERAVGHAIRERMMLRHLREEPEQAQWMAATFLVCGLLSMVQQWHIRGFSESPEDLARATVKMLSGPLLPDDRK